MKTGWGYYIFYIWKWRFLQWQMNKYFSFNNVLVLGTWCSSTPGWVKFKLGKLWKAAVCSLLWGNIHMVQNMKGKGKYKRYWSWLVNEFVLLCHNCIVISGLSCSISLPSLAQWQLFNFQFVINSNCFNYNGEGSNDFICFTTF